METSDIMIFSFNFFLMSYNYVILIFKYKKHSLKDLLTYIPSKNLIYSKIVIVTINVQMFLMFNYIFQLGKLGRE